MSEPNHPFVRRLRKSQVQRFLAPQQLCLRAEHGTLWVTVDGDPEDYVLDPGQSRTFDQSAPMMVTALGGDAVLSAVPSSALSAPMRPQVRSGLQAWPTSWLRWLVDLGRSTSPA